jgi:hypothetical protein
MAFRFEIILSNDDDDDDDDDDHVGGVDDHLSIEGNVDGELLVFALHF